MTVEERQAHGSGTNTGVLRDERMAYRIEKSVEVGESSITLLIFIRTNYTEQMF
jgi:hypothetical protein